MSQDRDIKYINRDFTDFRSEKKLSAVKGVNPISSSYKIIPSDQTSAQLEYCCPNKTSGAE